MISVRGLLLTIVMAAAIAPAPHAQALDMGIRATPVVIGSSWAVPSNVYGGTREINVWLPPGYADSGKTYPVLYVLDGGQDQDFHHPLKTPN